MAPFAVSGFSDKRVVFVDRVAGDETPEARERDEDDDDADDDEDDAEDDDDDEDAEDVSDDLDDLVFGDGDAGAFRCCFEEFTTAGRQSESLIAFFRRFGVFGFVQSSCMNEMLVN